MKFSTLLSIILLTIFGFGQSAHATTRTAIMKQEESVTEHGVQIRSSDPGSPVTDQFWYNTTSKALKHRESGNTRTITSPAIASAISAFDIDWSQTYVSGGIFTKQLTANSTFTFSNETAGQIIIVRLINDGTGGYTVSWPTVKWPGGTTPTMTTTASKSDVYTFFYDGTDVYGSSSQNH